MAKGIHPNSRKSHAETDHDTRTNQILDAYELSPDPLTDRQIAEALGFADMNAVRPCITRLVRDQIIVEADAVVCGVTGRTVRACKIRGA